MHLAFMGRWEESLFIVGGQGRSRGRAAPGGAGHPPLGRGREGRARSRREGGELGGGGGGGGAAAEGGVDIGEEGRRKTTKRNTERVVDHMWRKGC